jgi:type IV secretion system protein VirB4
MPAHLRSFGELRAFLGVASGGAGDRLRPWCAGNELGWVVDNPVDRISMSGQINGFDQTYYLDHPLACGPIQSYLFHRVGRLADGTPYIVAIDEFWKSLKNAAFRDLVFDGLKTFPKTGGAMWLATQSVADPMSVEGISHVVREQALTHMHFPNGSAETKDYGVAPNGLGLSERALWWIRVGLLGGGKGRFLLKQGSRCVPVQLSLEGDYLEEVRAELSGRTETVRLMDEIIAEMGLDDRDALFREFHARRKSPAFQRRLRRTELALVEQPA